MGLCKSVQDRMRRCKNHIKMYKIVQKDLRLYKSLQDYSIELHSTELHSAELFLNSNLHFRNTLFWLKRGLKKDVAGMGI